MTGARSIWKSRETVQKPTRMLLAANLSLLLFVWLAYAVLTSRAVALDESVRHAVHSWSEPFLTQVMLAATFVGRDGFMAVIGAFFVWRLIKAGRRHAAVLLIGGVVGAKLLEEVLKFLFHRQRPEPFFGLPTPDSYSFPSGHALTATVFYVLLASLMTRNPAIRAAAIALAALIGLSRIYLGVHYPTDVFAGYAAAVVWLAACQLLRKTLPRL
jgi:membrane-associated phospholipid phosphatase